MYKSVKKFKKPEGYYLYYIRIYLMKKKLTSKQNYFFINVALTMTAQVNNINL
jgi:hypothetical protein